MENISEYHIRQYKNVYRSTEVFVNWLEKLNLNGLGGANILDMACGTGANTVYMANRHKESRFVGLDVNEEYINYGNRQIEKYSLYENCSLYKGDWFCLEKKWIGTFDGIVSFQTLSWLPDYKEPLYRLTLLDPKWMAVSSLFYEGDIDYSIKLKDYYRASDGREYEEAYYNIYSLIRVREYLRTLGYCKFEYMPFEIDIDLPKPESMDIGTYTLKTEEGKRLQISAALMMPWYFIMASK